MSRATEIVDALITVWAVGMPATVTVVDGPRPSGATTDWLFVGWDGNPDTDLDTVVSNRTPSALGGVFDELVTVLCGIVVNGDDPKAVRDKAFTTFNTASNAVDNNTTLGLSGVTAEVPQGRFQYVFDENFNLQGWLAFSVEAQVL